MIEDKDELEKHLQLMHMLSLVFCLEKNEHLPSQSHEPTPVVLPKEEIKIPRFTALKAKLALHDNEPITSETNDGISDR